MLYALQVLKEELLSKLGMSAVKLGQRLVLAGSDGCAALMGQETGLHVQMKEQIAPHVLSVWCSAHRG